MKKILSLVTAAVLLSGAFAQAADTKPLVSIDSISIMQQSLEGKELTGKIQKEVEAFQTEVKKTQQDLSELQESLTKQAKVLSKEAMQEKTEELTLKKKELERKFADKEEALRASIQRKQIDLQKRQLKVITEVFEKEQWGAVIDKNTPGLLCVSNAIDKTDIVLRAVNEKYSTTKPSDKPATVKTAAAATAPEATSKPVVKVA